MLFSTLNSHYKLISTDKGETFELYNLLNDKSETWNIIQENQETAEQM